MMRFAALVFTLISIGVCAQAPPVPAKMQVAGITLTIRDDARREIQKDVDALTQHPKYFNIKAERAKTYFPIIEKIFEEERVPDDFKYLVLQESALIADAVSVSQAVGFWQFKDFTALEMGLRVDAQIDERMNIVSSTRGAARYIKKNNVYFNNWIYALQAYQMGAGAVMQTVKDFESGAKHMEITSKTYWYVKKFLAHKVAFEDAVQGAPLVKVITLENTHPRSLNEVAGELKLNPDLLLSYNKWVRKETIPGDRSYALAVPVEGEGKPVVETVAAANATALHEVKRKTDIRPAVASVNETKSMNGLPALRTREGENAAVFAKRAGISLSAFLKYNDISIAEPLVPGEYYYTRKKHTRAAVPSHVALSGETLWGISQHYGVQLKRIKKLNPSLPDRLIPGTTVLLAPSAPAVASATPVDVVELDNQPFAWSVNTEATSAIPQQPALQTISENEPQAEATQVMDVPRGGHTVTAGETLYGIAKRYGVSVMDLVQWNNLDLQQGIKAGQVLQVKKETPVQAASAITGEAFYVVKETDTLYSVARAHQVTIQQLMEWNGKKDFTVVTGEKLRVRQP
jgi:membrane-bound lytic murein transglycosylase D